MIEIWEVVNYEVVKKRLTCYTLKTLTHFHPFFTPIQPQISLHFALIPSQFSFKITPNSVSISP